MAEHLHELLGASSDALPAAHVRKPLAVEHLILQTPPRLVPYLRVVSGMQVREVIVEIDVRTDTRVEERETILYRPDPALVLGRYVLAGWSERDLPPSGLFAAIGRWFSG